MSDPKKHHFVPRFILRRFTDDKGKLHFFDKRIADRGVLAQTPDGLFVERHLYSTVDAAGNKDATIEKLFSTQESDASAIVEKIVEMARVGRKPQLTNHEKELWNRFLYLQWKRVPDSFRRVELRQNFKIYLQESIAEFEANHRPLTDKERARFEDPIFRDQLRRNASIVALAQPGAVVQEALMEKGLGVAIIGRPNKSFIIGSFPIVRFAHTGQAHISNPSVELWFPIAADVAVTPIFPRGAELLKIINENDIRAINEAIFRQSTLIAGRSRTLVEELIARIR